MEESNVQRVDAPVTVSHTAHSTQHAAQGASDGKGRGCGACGGACACMRSGSKGCRSAYDLDSCADDIPHGAPDVAVHVIFALHVACSIRPYTLPFPLLCDRCLCLCLCLCPYPSVCVCVCFVSVCLSVVSVVSVCVCFVLSPLLPFRSVATSTVNSTISRSYSKSEESVQTQTICSWVRDEHTHRDAATSRPHVMPELCSSMSSWRHMSCHDASSVACSIHIA